MKSDFSTNFYPNFDFTVKALTTAHSLNRRNFRMKAHKNAKIGSYTKLCTQKKIVATKT